MKDASTHQSLSSSGIGKWSHQINKYQSPALTFSEGPLLFARCIAVVTKHILSGVLARERYREVGR